MRQPSETLMRFTIELYADVEVSCREEAEDIASALEKKAKAKGSSTVHSAVNDRPAEGVWK